MEQSRAINALEPFLILARSASSPRAAADLVAQATSAPNTYVFAELLQSPNIQALAKTELSPYLRQLELFAWGTWTEYHAEKPRLPRLSEKQQNKLRLLSLLTLAAGSSAPNQPSNAGALSPDAPLSYPTLQSALDLPSPASLESLVTTAIYSSLLTGTLNPATRTVAITSVAPLRDLRPGSVPALLDTVASWSARCDAALADLDAEMEAVRARAAERNGQRRMVNHMLDAAEKEVERRQQTNQGALSGKRTAGEGYDEGDAMDVDDRDSSMPSHGSGKPVRSAKRGGLGFAKRHG
ncbi:hypothetical protein BDY21DRAFT_291106 [Lineolata rhizophorae]|uniref:PCI domain-containing protein n=1 Tax=Lineolata rhizophorae TaxID=578093 RepID=A0A6A6NS88_9PEZI|nr:hypothetical protein BDY21DRAFT_291106 [Lineolata rhizophorae]